MHSHQWGLGEPKGQEEQILCGDAKKSAQGLIRLPRLGQKSLKECLECQDLIAPHQQT